MTSQPPPISLSPATSDPNPDTSSSDPTPSPSALLHLLTLKHLSDAGFASTSRAASITLSSVLERYILATASACAKKAEHAGRRKVGSLDMVQVLEDRQGKGWVRDMEHWVGERGVREEWAGEGWERGLEGLEEQLETGLTLPQAMADLVVVPDDEVDEEEDSDSSDEHGEEAGTGDMEVDKVKVEEDTKPYLPPSLFRAGSPDTSWLPPLPTMSADPSYTPAPQSALAAIGNAKTPSGDYTARPSGPTRDDNELAGPSSLYAKFMTPLSFAESQISESFIDPSKGPALTKPVYEEPPQRSTLPSLLKAYEAIKNEGSVSLAQTPLRMQAGDLLKRVICPPDFDSAPDTLTYPLPGPKVPLGMASYSRPPDASAGEVSPDAALGGKGILPEPRIPINAQPDGVLARLVREMRSPYLPPSFRDRMLHVTPPPPLLAKDGTPILYGDPVRGPDRAALEVARGKPAPAPEEGAEEYYRYTYDPGPMGVEKWGRKLDVKSMGGERGRRVEASAVGEEVPRVERKVGAVTGALDGQSNGAREQQEGGPVQVRLRLDRTMTTPQVDVAVKDRQGQVTHGAGAAGPVGTAAAILEQAAEHENGDVVMAEANIFAPPPSMTTSALSASPSTTMHNQAQTASSPRASISLAPPRIRISTNSASPAAPSPAAAAQSAQSTSPLPAPPSATPPPAPPTPGTTGGVKIRLGGSFSAGGSAPKRPSSAVSPASASAGYVESPMSAIQQMSPAAGGTIETNEEGEQADRPAKRPTMKIRLPTAGVKQEHGV